MSASQVAELDAPATGLQLPRIDYAAHPAYGGQFKPNPRLRQEIEAKLAPIIDEVERSDHERGAAFGHRRGAGTDISREVLERGFTLRQLDRTALEPLARSAGPFVEIIRGRLSGARQAGGAITFKAGQEIVARDAHPDIWAQAEQAMKQSGLIQATADYAGSGHAAIRSVAVMVNQPGQTWCTNVFRGERVFEDPPTVGFHIDSATFQGLKLVLYLDDVGPDQGPFGVIPGSHLWEHASRGRVIRRAFDRSPFVSRAPGQRHAFASLPPELQLKAEFGGDMPPEAHETLALAACEHVATGPRGQLNIFVPEAIHRGGLARTGERQVMLISIGARPPARPVTAPGA